MGHCPGGRGDGLAPLIAGLRGLIHPAMSRCPTCKAPAQPRAQNAAFPFCSPRCRAIDLGKWFIGEYAVPGRPLEPGEAAPADGGEPSPQPDGDSK